MKDLHLIISYVHTLPVIVVSIFIFLVNCFYMCPKKHSERQNPLLLGKQGASRNLQQVERSVGKCFHRTLNKRTTQLLLAAPISDLFAVSQARHVHFQEVLVREVKTTFLAATLAID